MAFDIAEVLQQMTEAAGGVLKGELPKVRKCVAEALAAEREALDGIASDRLEGAIDDEDLRELVEGEREALEAALLACQVQSKVAVQKAVNAALGVFGKAVQAVL